MANEPASFYGRILIVVGVMVLFGLFTANPSTTGYAVKDTSNDNSFFGVKTFGGDTRTCADGSLYGECSTLIKPKYCVYGELADYCKLCGCSNGKVCQNHECA